jgi:hypothetical protein
MRHWVALWLSLCALGLLPSTLLSSKVSINLGDDYSVVIKQSQYKLPQHLAGGVHLNFGGMGSSLVTNVGGPGALSQQTLSDMDDVSVDRVVDILRANVQQWSFVESQLLEPNVNLAMPEIFIPLRHLSTTLELLGNVLFMREDSAAAVEALERACPLMELLPQNMMQDSAMHSMYHQKTNFDSQRFAAGCFSLLRQVLVCDGITKPLSFSREYIPPLHRCIRKRII